MGAFIRIDQTVTIRNAVLGSLTACALSLSPVTSNASSFDINLTFLGGLTASQEQTFSRAETFWESRIAGYQEGISLTGLTISVAGIPIDGAGGFSGLATPMGTVEQGGFTLASFSTMQFDSADLSTFETAGILFDVVVREMAHAIGFGTMWALNDLYINGSGLYTGAKALAAYQEEFDADATFVPVELEGGFGTADILWDEDWAGGPNEVMTANIDTPTFISRTTLLSLEDLGYLLAVPVPGTLILALSGMCFIILVARRKKFRN